MFVTYSPDGDAPREWEFKPGTIRSDRMSQIEKAYKRVAGAELSTTWDAWLIAMQQGSTPARRVMLWHLLSLDHPTLRVDDVHFASDELTVEYSRAELLAKKDEKLRAAKMMQPGVDEELAEFLDDEIAAAREGSEGKARSMTSSTATGPALSSSPDSPSTDSAS